MSWHQWVQAEPLLLPAPALCLLPEAGVFAFLGLNQYREPNWDEIVHFVKKWARRNCSTLVSGGCRPQPKQKPVAGEVHVPCLSQAQGE